MRILIPFRETSKMYYVKKDFTQWTQKFQNMKIIKLVPVLMAMHLVWFLLICRYQCLSYMN